MNKAFVREPDATADLCPRCGAKGEPVGLETVAAYLPQGKRPALADSANFCPSPQCKVAYFDALERVILTDQLTRPVYPKDPDAPICACFGLTRQDIEQDAQEGVVTRVREILQIAASPEAQCAQKAANGQPCTAYVQKCYMQCRAAKKS